MSRFAIKLHYVLAYAVLGAHLPYLPIYLNQLNFDRAQIGWVSAVFGVGVLLAPPILGALADRVTSNRLLIGVCYAIGAAALLVMALVESFGALLVAYTIYSLGFAAMMPLLDGLTFARHAEQTDQGRPADPYPSVRIWGTVGFMLPALGLFFPLKAAETCRPAIYGSAAIAATGFLLCWMLPRPARQLAGAVGRLPTAEAMRALWRSPVRHFVASVFLLSLSVAMFYSFFPLYAEELGIASEWVGLVIILGVVAEWLLMMRARPVLRVLGTRGVLAFGAGGMAVRLGLLALLPLIPVVVASQIFHAPLVLALYLVGPMYLNVKASESFRNSMQGLYMMLCFGVGRLVGATVGGYVAKLVDVPEGSLLDLRIVMGLASVLSLIATVWLLVAFRDAEACRRVRDEHA